jgi:UDP-N-acetyl-D-mannosaminuronate dehydrogenase
MSKAKVGILGYGEIGGSLAKVYEDYPQKFEIAIKDLNRDDGLDNLSVLNICIPYNDKFITIVTNQIVESNADLTIIHSTVLPGTTAKIKSMLSKKFKVVHSPVRGVHPELYEGIKTFVKFVGAEDDMSRRSAIRHLAKLDIKTEHCDNSVTTEIGKALSTTYYGVVIALHGEMSDFCSQVGANFDQAITRFNQTYNTGYSELGKDNLVRPVLYPPKGSPPFIGGHCVVSNAELLLEEFKSESLNLIMKYKRES